LRQNRLVLALAVTGALALGVAACGDAEEEAATGGGGGGQQQEQSADTQNLEGQIAIDGSSTVQPFAEAAAELFQEEAPNVRITVGGLGTGDGFERFCNGEIQISNASRPIDDAERQACEGTNVRFSEVQVANDGIAVVTHPALEIDCFTTQQLKRLLRPNSRINNYSELGDDFPDQEATFFTPGEESGTFDFFTEVLLETDAEQRTENVQTSANDNQLLTRIEGTEGALGYVGFSYAQEAGDEVNVVEVDAGNGCVAPSLERIQNGTYQPLARPIFMYSSLQALERPEVRAFMDFTLRNHQRIAEAARIVPMTDEQAQEAMSNLTKPSTGS